MEVEIVMSGICSFINMYNEDETILEPSVILLNATHETLGEHGAALVAAHQPGEDHPPAASDPPASDPPVDDVTKHDHDHIPYLAFDSDLVDVQTNPEVVFEVVENVPRFRFLRLEGVEVKIDGHDIGVPIIDSTFENVVSRELYWPESQGLWNPDAVPPRGTQPKKTAVKALMRFAHGKIFGGRLCPFKWKFTKLNGDTFARHFAEEVIYTYSDTEDSAVRVTLLDLETPDPEANNRKLTFTPKPGQSNVTLFLGNSIKLDMDTAVRRQRSTVATDEEVASGTHFTFFDALVDVGQRRKPDPPVAILPKGNNNGTGGGGTDGGICGPKKG
jgi:hypothetical protein